MITDGPDKDPHKGERFHLTLDVWEMKKKLTDKLIGSLRADPKGNDITVWDTDIPGLAVRVSSGGTRSFFIRYLMDGKKPRLTIGSFPQLTTAMARKAAQFHFGQIAVGQNPQTVKSENRLKQLTLHDLIEEYIQLDRVKNLATYRDATRLLRNMSKHLGFKQVCDVTQSDARSLHKKMSVTAPVQANRTLTMMTTLWNYAINQGYTGGKDVCPARGIERNKEKPRERYATDEELTAILKEIIKEENPYQRAYLLMLQTQNARSGALRTAKWEDFSEDLSTLTLYLTKNKKPTRLPLSKTEISLLKSLRKVHGNPYIFVGRQGGHLGKVNNAWVRICKAAGVVGLRMHDGRRTFGNKLLLEGESIETVSMGLSHSGTDVTKKHYAQIIPPNVRAAKERYSSSVLEKAGLDSEDQAE